MNFFEAEKRIVEDPQICGGAPTIRGTRITVRNLVDTVEAYGSPEAYLEDFDWLTKEDIEAAHVWLDANPEYRQEPERLLLEGLNLVSSTRVDLKDLE